MPAESLWILALAQDLIFGVQIGDIARRKGLSARFVRTSAEALASLADGPRMLLVDLNTPGVDTVKLIRQVRATVPELPVAAYVSHVQTELRQSATQAGAEPVWPRSAFAAKFPLFLDGLAASAS